MIYFYIFDDVIIFQYIHKILQRGQSKNVVHCLNSIPHVVFRLLMLYFSGQEQNLFFLYAFITIVTTDVINIVDETKFF